MIAAILAAGSSERFGSPKQIANFKDRPMICTIVEALPTEKFVEVVIVTGASHNLVVEAVKEYSVSILFNKDHATGLASSLRTAGSYAVEKQQDLLVTFADLAYVTKEDYNKLLAGYQGQPTFSGFSGTYGPPAIFPYPELAKILDQLEGDRGAKAFFKNPALIEIPNAAKDVDEPT